MYYANHWLYNVIAFRANLTDIIECCTESYEESGFENAMHV